MPQEGLITAHDLLTTKICFDVSRIIEMLIDRSQIGCDPRATSPRPWTSSIVSNEAAGRTAMQAITLDSVHGRDVEVPATVYQEDPLDEDRDGDQTLTTSIRGLTRLALVAAETASRFQREGVDHDAMAWLLAPRLLFGGKAAVEACLERGHCINAILLHGLSIGLDATPAQFSALFDEGPIDDDPGKPWSGSRDDRSPPGRRSGRRMRLYSATIVQARGGELLHAFHASVAPTASVVRERIRARFGSTAADEAHVRIGFDPNCPSTLGLIPPAVMDTLLAASRRRRWVTPAILDITVEQRLPS